MIKSKLPILIFAFFHLVSNSQVNDNITEDKFHSVNNSVLELLKQYPIVEFGASEYHSIIEISGLKNGLNMAKGAISQNFLKN